MNLRRIIGVATVMVALAIAASSIALVVEQLHAKSSAPPGLLTGVCSLSGSHCFLHYVGRPITLKEVDLYLSNYIRVKAVLPYQLRGNSMGINVFFTPVALAEPVGPQNPLYANIYVEAVNSSSHMGLYLEVVAAKHMAKANVSASEVAEKTVNLTRIHADATVSFNAPISQQYAYYVTINVEGKGYVLATLKDPSSGISETSVLQADYTGPGWSSSTLIPLTGELHRRSVTLHVKLLRGGPVKVTVILWRAPQAYVRLVTTGGSTVEARVPVIRWIR